MFFILFITIFKNKLFTDGDRQVAGAISINFKPANWSSELTAAVTNPNGSINTGITKSITVPKRG